MKLTTSVGLFKLEGDELMKDIFKNIDPEKRDRIINSALEEFSKNRFDKASTNNIVKNAGISKGLLYHYFTSKKKLYDNLIVFAIEMVMKTIVDEVDWEQPDLFKRIKDIVLIKLKVCAKYPHLIAFSKVMYEGKSIDEIKELAETYMPDMYHQVYHRNIDFSLFKENVDVEKAIKITQSTLERQGEEWLASLGNSNGDIDFDWFIKEIDEYLKMLIFAFYK